MHCCNVIINAQLQTTNHVTLWFYLQLPGMLRYNKNVSYCQCGSNLLTTTDTCLAPSANVVIVCGLLLPSRVLYYLPFSLFLTHAHRHVHVYICIGSNTDYYVFWVRAKCKKSHDVHPSNVMHVSKIKLE